jgi:hypothetical protein
VYSTNPGSDATRTVQHPFELAPVRSTAIGAPATAAAVKQQKGAGFVPSGPDELMIVWNTLPRQTEVDLYLPQIKADDIVGLAGLRIGPDRVERVDDHTVRLQVGDVTYLPLPDFGAAPLAGLATLRLPRGVRYEQVFRVVFLQITAARRVVGQFELRVRVEKAESIVEEDVNTLAVVRHVAAARPANNRWKPVLLRYAEQLAARVRGLGVDPDLVQPSPLGSDGSPALKTDRLCRLLGWLALLLAVVAPPLVGLLFATGAAAFAWLAPIALLALPYLWPERCLPGFCRSLRNLGFCLLLGAALLVLVGGPAVPADRLALLAVLLVLSGGVALMALAKRCGCKEK